MQERTATIPQRLARGALISVGAAVTTVVMTWPLAARFGRLGRTTSADGQYAIWNVAWVARTLTEEPLRLFDANIFYPHRWALAFSELNLVAGIVAIPGWLLTENPYVAHNSALVFAFSTSALCAWLLARYLCRHSAPAIVAGVAFAFCPYFFAHTAHIQLLMGGGIPLSLLMLHKLVDAPSRRAGILLGAALAAQALACAYYGILAGLMVGYASIFLAISRRLWQRQYWMAIGVAAVVSIACIVPFFIPFLGIQESGFHRTLDESRRYSANLASYMASSAHAHKWLLDLARHFGRWTEVLFPGGVALVLGLIGFLLAVAGPRYRPDTASGTRDREAALMYGSLGMLTLWATFGPSAGFYTALFHALPLMSFLRAPSRFGVFIPLALGVLAALALSRLNPRILTPVSLAVAGITLLELNTAPIAWTHAPTVPRAYAMLARVAKGPVAEFPFYGERVAFPLHAQYMLFSTVHWQPLLNGYSDHIPQDFREAAVILDTFPSNHSFAVLRRRRIRYITVNWDMFGPRRDEIEERLRPFARHLRELASDDLMTLYEVVSFP